jgi:hypothetical protein
MVDFRKMMGEEKYLKAILKEKERLSKMFQVKGIRMNKATNISDKVTLNCYIWIDKNNEKWVKIDNGVTGYEGAKLNLLLANDLDWVANMGSINYDRLVVDGKDLNIKIKENMEKYNV